VAEAFMKLDAVNPDSLCRPRGYNHGMRGHGELVFVAGQVGWNREGHMVSDDFVGQFAQALDNVLDVVWAAGGSPQSLARMVVYVTDKREYVQSARQVGEVWRHRLGKHFPAMALVEVKGLLDDQARVEIEAVAIV
jgi:enamine deaminase RidA (YjgF/YER057c/UK114 family)